MATMLTRFTAPDTPHRVFRLLGNSGRLGIVRALADRPMLATELADAFDRPIASIHNDLCTLRHAGLVRTAEQRENRKIRYEVDHRILREASSHLSGLVYLATQATAAPDGGMSAASKPLMSHASDDKGHPATNQREPARRSEPRDAEGETTALTVADRRAGQINEAS